MDTVLIQKDEFTLVQKSKGAFSQVRVLLTMLWEESSMPVIASFFMKTVYMGQITFLGTDFSAGFFITTLVSTAVMICCLCAIGNFTFKRLDLN